VSGITEMPSQLEMGARVGENGASEGCPDFGLKSHHIWDGLLVHGDEVASLWGLITSCVERDPVAFKDGIAVRRVAIEGFVSAFEERGRHCCRWLERPRARMAAAAGKERNRVRRSDGSPRISTHVDEA